MVYLPPEDHDPAGNARMRSAGLPMPGAELKIIGEDGETSGPNQVGEVAVRSPANMAGYWKLPEATADTIGADGWLRTGDAGYIDEDGYLFIHDRVKDMIISGGENIYPAEVESAVYGHPHVAEVAVIGVPDDKWGEAVKAVVALKPGAPQDPSRHHRLRPDPHRRLQGAQDHRLHRGPAAQRLGQDPAARTARAVLGGQGPTGELMAPG